MIEAELRQKEQLTVIPAELPVNGRMLRVTGMREQDKNGYILQRTVQLFFLSR